MPDWLVQVKVPKDKRAFAQLKLAPVTGVTAALVVKVYWSVGVAGGSKQNPRFGYPDDYDTTNPRTIDAADLTAGDMVNIAANIYVHQPLNIQGSVTFAGTLTINGVECPAEASVELQPGKDTVAAALVWWITL